MAVKRIDPGASLRCSPGQATLGWSVGGAAAGDVALHVVRRDAPGRPAVAVQRTGVEHLRIAALPAPAVVQVQPAGGGVFADGTTISAELTLRDGDQYVLGPADVSGTAAAELLTLTPEPGAWVLAVPADVVIAARAAPGPRTPTRTPSAADGSRPVPEPSADEQSGDLTVRATYAARRRARTARLPPEQRTELHVAVDRSASVLPFVRSGAGQALLEVLLGVNAVCGRDEEVPVWEISPVPRRTSTPLSSRTAAGYWDRVLGERASTGGTLLAPLVRDTSAATAHRTVVVLTDGVPADLPRVAETISGALAQGRPVRWHLLVLGRGPSDPDVRREPWRDELAALQPLVHDGLLTLTSVTPHRGSEWLAARLTDAAALEELVGSFPLLAGTA